MAWSYVVPALIATGAAVAVPAAASADYFRAFRSPTGKLGCAFYSDDQNPRTVRCDWAGGGQHSLTLNDTGKAHHLKISDTVRDPGAKVLAYGKTTSYGHITCTSRASGITCKNASHHGFTVSVQKQRVF